MTWKAQSRGSGTGLIGKLAQANIDEVAPVDDEVIVVRDEDPSAAPLRQRLTASTLLRVREVTGVEDLGPPNASGRVRAVVLCHRGLSLAGLHDAVAQARARCPEVAVVVLEDQRSELRQAVASRAGADSLVSLAEDWKAVGDAVLEAAERRARGRAIDDALSPQPEARLLGPLGLTWPLSPAGTRAATRTPFSSPWPRPSARCSDPATSWPDCRTIPS